MSTEIFFLVFLDFFSIWPVNYWPKKIENPVLWEINWFIEKKNLTELKVVSKKNMSKCYTN